MMTLPLKTGIYCFRSGIWKSFNVTLNNFVWDCYPTMCLFSLCLPNHISLRLKTQKQGK